MKKTELINTSNFIIKVSLPLNLASARAALMLHGWTGDENSMWAFTNQLDEDWLLIAPRAPYPTDGSDLGGFSWVNQRIDHWPQFIDFLPAVDQLHSDLADLEGNFPDVAFNQLAVFGFSQGAAMSFVYSMVHKERVGKLALLSGFIPDNSEGFIQKNEENSLEIFFGHGDQDQIVPVEMAHEGKQLFETAGYKPRSCISDVGHRLGSDCFRALTDFLNKR